MPDPDLPPIVIEQAYIDKIKAEMPVMPDEWRKRLSSLGLDKAAIETLIDAEVEFPEANLLASLEATLNEDKDFSRGLANWMVNILVPHYREEGILTNDVSQRLNNFRATFQLAQDSKLSSTNAKALVIHISDSVNVTEDINIVIQDKNLIQVSDEGEIAKIVEQILADNPKAAEDVKNGEMKAIGFLVGQVMKASKGKANPSLAQDLIKRQLA